MRVDPQGVRSFLKDKYASCVLLDPHDPVMAVSNTDAAFDRRLDELGKAVVIL
jgi:hypothetical protein